MSLGRVIIIASAVLLSLQLSLAQDVSGKDTTSIEIQRAEQIRKWGTEKLVKPKQVAKVAKALLAKPLEEQTIEELSNVAEQANAAANLIGFIVSEYDSYYRDNYRYEFVQKKVAPFHAAYASLSNEFISYRNRCYFNLGMKYKAVGNEVAAFFYFRDAFRLSNFTESEGDHKGMRYKAEIEMKKLLGLDETEIGTFVTWQE